MARDSRPDLPTGITVKTRREDGVSVPAIMTDGTVLYRVRMWDPVLKKQIERVTAGLEAAERLLADFNAAKRRPGRVHAERARFADVAARYLVAYRYKRDGTLRPKSSLAKERTCLNVYLLPVLGNAWIGDLDLPDLNSVVRNLALTGGTPASGGTKSAVAAVLRRLFAWAREERIIRVNPALELRTGWGSSVRRKVVIPSIRKCCAWPPLSITSNRAWAMSRSSWRSPACGGKRPSPCRSARLTSPGRACSSTGPRANRAGAATSARTSRPGPPSGPS